MIYRSFRRGRTPEPEPSPEEIRVELARIEEELALLLDFENVSDWKLWRLGLLPSWQGHATYREYLNGRNEYSKRWRRNLPPDKAREERRKRSAMERARRERVRAQQREGSNNEG